MNEQTHLAFFKLQNLLRASLGIGCSLHELRYTMTSIVKADVPETLLKQVVGHSASMDTQGVYGHRVDGEAQRAAGLISQAFDRLLE